MDEKQRAALERFMHLYDEHEALGNFEKKVVGKMGIRAQPGVETTKCIQEAYEDIRSILESQGNVELVAWFDEMYKAFNDNQREASILYVAFTGPRPNNGNKEQ